MKKKSILFIFLSMINCIAKEPFYLVHQGYTQIKYLLNREKMETVYKKNLQNRELIYKLDLLFKIKEFASSELYLNTENQYKYYLEIKQEYISYIVIASEKLNLKPIQYWFPFVGTIQYLGFFQREKAQEYAEYLKDKGYDVRISGASAYSTLGWFSDPLLSLHIKYTDENFISLIIHELTHSTFWDKRNNVFNETLASFVEEKGTIKFIKKYYLDSDERIKKYLGSLNESEKLKSIFFFYKQKLLEVYRSNLSDKEKTFQKEKVFLELKETLLKNQNDFQYIKLESYKNKRFNNADFVLLNLYDNQEYYNFFNKIYNQCNEDFDCFWKVLKNNTYQEK